MIEKIISKDGTILTCNRTGSGTPLILVHGTNGNSSHWNLVQPYLEQHFTLYKLDRRGRGESGDHPEYTIEKEFEDISIIQFLNT
ncbi:MAG: alpha/beta fold hydrolase [Chloroflexota bacterium]